MQLANTPVQLDKRLIQSSHDPRKAAEKYSNRGLEHLERLSVIPLSHTERWHLHRSLQRLPQWLSQHS